MEKLLLTGEPGVGKSTLLDKLHQKDPTRISGVLAREIRDTNGVRQGFYSGTFEDPELVTIAHVSSPSEVRVGKYGVNISALDSVAKLLAHQSDKAKSSNAIVSLMKWGGCKRSPRN